MSNQCSIDVRFFPPPPELDGCFSSFYRLTVTVEGGARAADYLLPEWANVRFFAGDRPKAEVSDTYLENARLTATGPSSLATRFELGTTRAWGVGLFPLGWAKFAKGDAATMANALVDGEAHPAFSGFGTLADVLFDGRDDDDREHAILIDHFMKNNKAVPDEGRIMAVHRVLVDANVSTVKEFADGAGVGQRTLERLCRRYFGFPPKLLLRRQRFIRSLADFMTGSTRNWTDSLDDHYHDQAHFTREFRSFMKMSPSDYARLDHPILSAFMMERARIWGTPAQTLDRPAS